MTKKEEQAIKRFAAQVAKEHGEHLVMKGMKILETGDNGDGGIRYAMVETSDGIQWQAWRAEDGYSKFSRYPEKSSQLDSEAPGEQTALAPQPEPADNDVIVYSQREADDAVEYIRANLAAVANSFCRIGFKLWEVREKKLYAAFGAKNVAEFGENLFGLKRASVQNYIQVCEKFSVRTPDGTPTEVLSGVFAAYSFTQLTEIMRLPEGKEMDVRPEMSCKEIRALKEEAPAPELDEPEEYTETKTVFCRVLTAENMDYLIRQLKKCVGSHVNVEMEITHTKEQDKAEKAETIRKPAAKVADNRVTA